MIRINLLGQTRPRARGRAAVPAGATMPIMLLVVSLLVAGGWVYWRLGNIQKEVEEQQARKIDLTDKKNRLIGVQQEVTRFEQQKVALEQQKQVIDELQRNRTGGQELLQVVADTVSKSEQLWLTSITRKGSALTMDGTAASINSVANFITELKRSGYFGNIEIKEAKQDDKNTAVTTFLFSLTADLTLPQAKPPASPAPGKS
jgi:Tfp pilus assembly protein PilN